MDIIDISNNYTYTYKIKDGISDIKGGVNILTQLNYPHEIIDNMKDIIKDINI